MYTMVMWPVSANKDDQWKAVQFGTHPLPNNIINDIT